MNLANQQLALKQRLFFNLKLMETQIDINVSISNVLLNVFN